MPNIQIIRTPGYIYDLLFIFFHHYNKENFSELFGTTPEEEKKIYETMASFKPTSNDLYVFFRALVRKRCFLTSFFFSPYRNHFADDYGFDFLQEKLSHSDRVIRKIISFYFSELSAEEIEACAASTPMLFEKIKKSDYSAFEKNKLYEFFIDPIPYIERLREELAVMEKQLAAYYDEHYDAVLLAYQTLTFDILNEQLTTLHSMDDMTAETENVYLSFCLLNFFCISFYLTDSEVIALLGIHYTTSIDILKNKTKPLRLHELGSALADENRVRMLELMLERGEISCKEIEQHFRFSASTAYHHLTTMLRYGAIKSRTEGKTVLYSINHSYFNTSVSSLQKFCSATKNPNV